MSLNCLPRCVIKFRKWRKRLEIWEQHVEHEEQRSYVGRIVSVPTGNYFYASPFFFFSFGTKCVNRNAVGELVERSWFTCCFHGKEVDTFRRRGGCWYPRNYFWILLRNSNIINEIVRIVLVNFLLFLLFFLILKNIKFNIKYNNI